MHYVLYCLDKSGHSQLRADNRNAHLDYLKKFGAAIFAAGPLLDDAGTGMVGSLLIMDFADRAAVDAFLAGDPYSRAGLFASVRVTPWRKVYPQA
jgi:uncharacterized protein YciI